MYRRPKFLEILLDIRQEMAREADYDVDLFAEIVRSGVGPRPPIKHSMDGDERNAESGRRSSRTTRPKGKP